MEIKFNYAPERQFYAVRFEPGDFETRPFIGEMRFWGVDRFPCRQLSSLAALIALKTHPVRALTMGNTSISPAVCTALTEHFGVELFPGTYDINRRHFPGGEKSVAPARLGSAAPLPEPGIEMLTWMSLDDLGGPLGGHIRTNIDVFEVSEPEKNLIVALCCAGMDVGHILVDGADPELAKLIHLIGLELVPNAKSA
ncbi:MAG: hypothetical protein AAGO57_07295 [Pseudomonadota bacterium]